MRGFLSIDIDVSELKVNQCESKHLRLDYTQTSTSQYDNNIYHQYNFRNNRHYLQSDDDYKAIGILRGTHKCHRDTMHVCIFVSVYFCLHTYNLIFLLIKRI